MFKNLHLKSYNATIFQIIMRSLLLNLLTPDKYLGATRWDSKFYTEIYSENVLKSFFFKSYNATICMQAFLDKVDSILFKLLSKTYTGAPKGVNV